MTVPNRLRQAIRVVFLVLAVAVVATFAVIGVPQLVGAEHSFVVLSGSMEPEISPGDVVLINDVPPEEIAVGETITFADGPRPTTHQVIDVVRDGDIHRFKTKGLANEDPDQGWVPAESVIGTVMLVIPYAGHVVMLANTRFGAALFLIIPGALLILNEAWLFLRDYRSRSDPEVHTDGD